MSLRQDALDIFAAALRHRIPLRQSGSHACRDAIRLNSAEIWIVGAGKASAGWLLRSSRSLEIALPVE